MGGGPVNGTETPGFASHELATGWAFRQTESKTSSWLPVKCVPSTLQQDLLDNGLLEHPFVGFNEAQASWVAEKSWTYRTQFHAPARSGNTKTVLVFDGLDTFAEVRLDGKVILRSENMFVQHRVDVTDALADEGRYTLEIEFEPALLKARKVKQANPDHKWICDNGESARLAVRKAQYHWGWDWGPELMCAGIWKPIRLEAYAARIGDFRCEVALSAGCKQATLNMTAHIEETCRDPLQLTFSVIWQHEIISQTSFAISAARRYSEKVVIDQKRLLLWMPVGHGPQHRYDIRAEITDRSGLVHRVKRSIGLRKVELIREPDGYGKSFHFRINGVDIFCGGSCWIPADSFLTTITEKRYRKWLELVVRGNQNMIRIWGGGIYEDDSLYDICDELGILVWQDFAFACGNYPVYPSILDSIKVEATQNLRRLRHHPSLVLLAGNNEDYQLAEFAGLTYHYSDHKPENWLKTDFPARYIYEKLLPDIVQEECPSIPYHPGSPWGDGKPTSDPSVGDLHQWNVWHGTQELYQCYPSLGGRFVSEFGMQALPHIQTIQSFVPPDHEVGDKNGNPDPQSRLMDFHNKANGHTRRLATYLSENVRTSVQGLTPYIHLTQLIQAEALSYAYRGWRKQWGRTGQRQCGGALVWQLNDCWPVTSWSMVDYYLRPKAAFYAVKRCLAPVAVTVRREHWDWSLGRATEPQSLRWEIWGVSITAEDVTVDVEVRFWGVELGGEVREQIFKKGVVLKANATTEIAHGVVDNTNTVPHVVAVRMWHGGQIVARDMDWPQPLKYLTFPERNLQVEQQGGQLRVSVERPVKCLVFEERDGCGLSDSALDLAPGDEQVVTVEGLSKEGPSLGWRYLGQEEQ